MKKYSLIIIFLFSFIISIPESTYAKSAMWTKNESNMLFYFADRWGCCGWTKALGSRMISVKYNVEVKNISKNSEVVGDGSSVAVGSKLRFIFTPHQSEDIYWFGTGYTQDSPYGDWVKNAAERSGSDCDEKDLVSSNVYSYEGGNKFGPYDIYIPLSINPPESKTLTNTNGMTCGSKQGSESAGFYYDCTINSILTISPKFNIGSTYGKFYYKYWDYRNYGDHVAGCYETDYPLSSVDGGGNASKGSTYVLQVPSQTITYNIKSREPMPPNKPVITGPTQGYINKQYDFSLSATHPDGIDIQYGLDWDKDGTVDEIVPSGSYLKSGTSKKVSKVFSILGKNTFQALTIDKSGKRSSWTSHTIEIFPLPVINLSLNPANIINNNQSNIVWTVSNVSSCVTGGEWRGTNIDITAGEHSISTGIKTINVASKKYSYTLKCFGLLSDTSVYDTKTVELTVSSLTPTVALVANPPFIMTSNSSSTLTWQSENTNPNSCKKSMVTGSSDTVWTKSPNSGLPTSGSGSTQLFTKDGIYTYKISCTGGGSTAVATTSVQVKISGSDLKLIAIPDKIVTANSSSTLVWMSTSTTANSCKKSMVVGIDNSWSGTKKPTSGSQSTKIYDTNGIYTYMIECSTPSGGKLVSTTTVNVSVPVPVVSLIANPSSVGRTSSSTLIWSSTNTNNNSCVKSMIAKTDSTWSGTGKPTSGSQSTRKYGTSLTSNSYDGDYIYKITCSGPAGTASSTATVTVGEYPQPSVVITGPDSVESGTTPVLTWTAANSSSCTKTAGNGTWSGTVNNISVSPYEKTELPGPIDKTTTYTINCVGQNGSTGNVSKIIRVDQCAQDNWACTKWSPDPCTVGQVQSRICTNNIINQCPSNIIPKPEVTRICSNTVTIFQPLCQAYQNFGSGYREASTGTIYVNRDMEWRATNIPEGSYYMTNNFGDSKEVTVYDKLIFYKLYQNPGIKNFSVKLESIDGTSKGECSTTTNAVNQNQVIIEE